MYDAKAYLEDKACLRKSRAELREQEKKQSQMITRFYNYEAKRREKMSDIIFVEGFKVKQKFDGLLGVSIKLEDFIKFMEANKNEKGYLNIDICKSKDKDAWYARLNTWKPEKKEESITNANEIDNIPF